MAAQRRRSARLIEPDMLKSPIIRKCFSGCTSPMRCAWPAGRDAVVVDDGPCHIFAQNALDLPNNGLAFVAIGFLRRLIEQRLDLRVAVVRVLGLRVAGIGAFQPRVGIIDTHTRRAEGRCSPPPRPRGRGIILPAMAGLPARDDGDEGLAIECRRQGTAQLVSRTGTGRE
jgi:hypothetical protein